MHFPIITIESLETEKADFMTDFDYEDPVLNANTDYYGIKYCEEKRRDVINSDWLSNLLKGYATIDTEKETITFLDADTIRANFTKYIRDLAQKLVDEMNAELGKEKASCSFLGYKFRNAGEEYRGYDADGKIADWGYSTFFYDGYGMTSFAFIENAIWHAGETVKIGNIFDAHN